MARPTFQVADVFRRHGEAYREANAGHLDRCQRRVMAAIEACRTAALGGYVRCCKKCGHKEIAYCSCRDRQPYLPRLCRPRVAGSAPGGSAAG